jgi:hypothetical protein
MITANGSVISGGSGTSNYGNCIQSLSLVNNVLKIIPSNDGLQLYDM